MHSFTTRTTTILICLTSLLAIVWGCSTIATRPPTQVHYVQIRDSITPMDLYVSVGDQVRWQNLRPDPVRIGIMRGVDLEKTSCEKGFSSFGVMDDFATIKPRDYVSLCFGRPGVVHYNIWMDAKNHTGNITRTAVIHVRRS
jgi:hypothetical protein